MSGTVGGGDEAEEEEDEVGHPQDAGELLVQDLLSVGHLLLRVPPESVPPDNLLEKNGIQDRMQSYELRSEGIYTNKVHSYSWQLMCNSSKPRTSQPSINRHMGKQAVVGHTGLLLGNQKGRTRHR